jgi:hypothetical protein
MYDNAKIFRKRDYCNRLVSRVKGFKKSTNLKKIIAKYNRKTTVEQLILRYKMLIFETSKNSSEESHSYTITTLCFLLIFVHVYSKLSCCTKNMKKTNNLELIKSILKQKICKTKISLSY